MLLKDLKFLSKLKDITLVQRKPSETRERAGLFLQGNREFEIYDATAARTPQMLHI